MAFFQVLADFLDQFLVENIPVIFPLGSVGFEREDVFSGPVNGCDTTGAIKGNNSGCDVFQDSFDVVASLFLLLADVAPLEMGELAFAPAFEKILSHAVE